MVNKTELFKLVFSLLQLIDYLFYALCIGQTVFTIVVCSNLELLVFLN